MRYGSEATFLFEATSTKKYLCDYFIYIYSGVRTLDDISLLCFLESKEPECKSSYDFIFSPKCRLRNKKTV